MRFPNAASGVKKLFIAEILNLIAIACFGGALAFAAIIKAGENNIPDATKEMLLLACIPLLVGAAIPAVIGYVFKIIGLYKAHIDEPVFKTAFYCVFIGLAATICQSIFSGNDTVVRIMALVADISDLIGFIFIITGIRNLCVKMGRNDLDRQGLNIFKVLVLMYLLIICADIISIIFGGAGIVAAVIAIIAAALGVIQYVMYLLFLAKANSMLKK